MTRSEEYLWYITNKGAREIYGELPQEVIDRIQLEMDVIIPNNFTDYILMLWDIHNFCRTPSRVFEFCEENNIQPPSDGIVPLGPGRGSVGGSIVCYCIGIHECDPILFGLFFERFLNPERISYPDIDFDVSQRYRHIVIAYIAYKYGEKHVAQIITYSTLSVRTVLKDVLQSAGVSDTIISIVKATLPSDPGITMSELNDNEKFINAMKSIPFPDSTFQVTSREGAQRILELDTFRRGEIEIDSKNMAILLGIMNGTQTSGEIIIKSSWDWEKAIRIMKRIEGLNKNESTHAAGVVVSPTELESSIPLMKKGNNGTLACQYDMRMLEALGYLKMDVLGLRTVDVNHDSERLVRQWYDQNFDVRMLRYDDTDAIKLINDGDTVGIFQIESTGFTQMMQQLDIGGYEVQRYADRDNTLLSQIEQTRGLEIADFMWVSAGIALYRPGPLDAVIEGKTMVQHLIDRKAGKEPITYLFPEEKGYLEETYGILVYQEQVMARVRAMTGCTLGRADILRKAMGKKDPVLMKEQMDWFIQASSECDFSIVFGSLYTDNPDTAKTLNHKRQIIDRAKEEIEKFARYGFNKAHTVEYAHICYRNAYFKAHYPVAFYTSILNSETDDPKRQTILIRDMLKHNIELLPPTINQSGAEFTMTDEKTIRFGITAIKNIGKRAVSTIFTDRNENGKYNSVEEFRVRIPATDCTVIGMTNLAKCGAFDEFVGDNKKFKNRATLVASMKNLCDNVGKLTKKKGKNKPKPTVEEALLKLDAVSYPIIQTDGDVIEYAIWEKEILKYYISAHPIDAYQDEMRRWNAIEDTEYEDLPSEFYIAGFVENVHETVIKKEGRNKGKAMGFVTIGTAYRTYDGTMFPGIYESCLPYLTNGNAVVMKGKRNYYNDQVTIQVEYIRNMTNQGIRDCPEFHIRLDPNIPPLTSIQIQSVFKQHPGTTRVLIHVMSEYNDIILECPSVTLNDHIIDTINAFNIPCSYKGEI